ncbi:MAG: hypothetical protein H0V18_14425 [Pyrinomonadaceae bacterium]|nr:hypothetical protein [Pyrinomonadaceae bacterium]
MSLLAGYATLHPLARSGSAVSDAAGTVHAAASAVVESVERSFALFGPKAAAISQIWSLVDECAEVGWDGQEAEPISEVAAALAADFIRALPKHVPLPELAPEPDGSISLDWIRSRHRLFSLSVGASSRLAYAWLDGTDRGHAVARFDGETVPPGIIEGIKRVMSYGNAAVGPL